MGMGNNFKKSKTGSKRVRRTTDQITADTMRAICANEHADDCHCQFPIDAETNEGPTFPGDLTTTIDYTGVK